MKEALPRQAASPVKLKCRLNHHRRRPQVPPLLSLGLNCTSETSGSSESAVPSTSTVDTERACKVPAQREQTRKKLCCEGLTRKQMEVLTRSTTLVIGLWHCVQELMVVSLGLFKEEFIFVARTWRGNEGRLKFWVNGGSLNELYLTSRLVIFR